MYEFSAVLPVGKRTYSALRAGAPAATNRWLDEDVPEFVEEWDRLQDGSLDQTLTRPQNLDALGAIRSLRGKAARGKLRVGDDAQCRSRRLKRLDYLLELRPSLAGGSPPPRLFRLYYAEPANVDDALLPLVVATKPNAEDVNDEVNSSIDDAKTRSRTWAFTRALEESQR